MWQRQAHLCVCVRGIARCYSYDQLTQKSNKSRTSIFYQCRLRLTTPSVLIRIKIILKLYVVLCVNDEILTYFLRMVKLRKSYLLPDFDGFWICCKTRHFEQFFGRATSFSALSYFMHIRCLFSKHFFKLIALIPFRNFDKFSLFLDVSKLNCKYLI